MIPIILCQEAEIFAGEKRGQRSGFLSLHGHELRQSLEDNEQKEWRHVCKTLIPEIFI